MTDSNETRIHPTAILSDSVEIGRGVEIGPYAILDGRIRIGDGTKIHAHAQILNSTTLGARCEVHGYALVGGKPQDRKFEGEDTEVVIGDDTIIREGVTIHLGTGHSSRVTRVGSRVLVMANVHIAHDCQVADDVTMSNSTLLAGHVHVQAGATISGATVIHQFTTIGRLAMIGGLARVSMDVPPFLIVEGRPGKVRGLNVVGLRRRGVSEESVERLKETYRLLFLGKKTSAESYSLAVERAGGSAEVHELLEFLRRTDSNIKGRYLEALRKAREDQGDQPELDGGQAELG